MKRWYAIGSLAVFIILMLFFMGEYNQEVTTTSNQKQSQPANGSKALNSTGTERVLLQNNQQHSEPINGSQKLDKVSIKPPLIDNDLQSSYEIPDSSTIPLETLPKEMVEYLQNPPMEQQGSKIDDDNYSEEVVQAVVDERNAKIYEEVQQLAQEYGKIMRVISVAKIEGKAVDKEILKQKDTLNKILNTTYPNLTITYDEKSDSIVLQTVFQRKDL